MAKEVVAQIKLQIPAGSANPAPPVGPALGQQGVNIMAFCKEFNARTQKQAGDILPVVITVYKDKSFTFITKQPPASSLIKKALKIASGSKEPIRAPIQPPPVLRVTSGQDADGDAPITSRSRNDGPTPGDRRR